jgi:hypothetical protein
VSYFIIDNFQNLVAPIEYYVKKVNIYLPDYLNSYSQIQNSKYFKINQYLLKFVNYSLFEIFQEKE